MKSLYLCLHVTVCITTCTCMIFRIDLSYRCSMIVVKGASGRRIGALKMLTQSDLSERNLATTHTHTHKHTYPHTHTHTLALSHMQTHTHTHTHTHFLYHTHAHTCSWSIDCSRKQMAIIISTTEVKSSRQR